MTNDLKNPGYVKGIIPNSVHVVLPRRFLPFPAVVGKVNVFDELPELPGPVGFSLRPFRRDDPGDFLPSFAFGHVPDRTDHLAFPLAIDVPHADPAATLLSDTS